MCDENPKWPFGHSERGLESYALPSVKELPTRGLMYMANRSLNDLRVLSVAALLRA